MIYRFDVVACVWSVCYALSTRKGCPAFVLRTSGASQISHSDSLATMAETASLVLLQFRSDCCIHIETEPR